MILRNLRRSELQAFEEAITQGAILMDVSMNILNSDEKVVGSLTSSYGWEHKRFKELTGILDGQIDVDDEADVTHQLTATILDTQGSIIFDKNSPARSGIFVSNFVSVKHLYWVEALDEWVAVPTFYGPVMGFSRSGFTVSIECQGKERLQLHPFLLGQSMDFDRGDNAVNCIKRLLRANGEERFDFPDFNRRLYKDFSVGRGAEPWIVARRIARSINCQLYYDGAGKCRLRKWPEEPVGIITDGFVEEMASPSEATAAADAAYGAGLYGAGDYGG